jgi:hypothetical protein
LQVARRRRRRRRQRLRRAPLLQLPARSVGACPRSRLMAVNFYGKHKMAGVNECFSVGSVVMCTNCFDEEIEGEVLGFEPTTKMLILSILLL